MESKKINVLNVEYDIDVSDLRKQPDIALLEKFVDDDTRENVRLTYEDKFDAKKRQMVVRTWLLSKGYLNISTHVRDNTLTIIKRKEEYNYEQS